MVGSGGNKCALGLEGIMYGNGFVNSFFTILDQTFFFNFFFFFVMLTHDEHHSIKIQL